MAGGILANHLMKARSTGKLSKPTLQISARVETPYPGETSPDQYMKQDAERTKKEIASIQKALDAWVPEDVAARAEKSLRSELAIKKARLAEYQARLDSQDEEEMEGDEEESEEE